MNRADTNSGSQAVRVRRTARLLRRGVLGGIAVLLVVTFAALLNPRGANRSVAAIIEIHEEGVPHAAALVLAVLLCGLLTVGLIRLLRMLRRIESGELFSPLVKAFTLFALLSAVVSTLGPPAIHLISLLGRNGGRELTLGADSSDIWLLLFTGLLFLIARLLDEAIRIVDDHQQII